MLSALVGAVPFGAVIAAIDLDGFLFGQEMAAIMAALFTAFFSGIANVLLGGAFAGGA
ncbi:MAG TPA: hypothetical protein VM243_01080 [Phycisphaerae bacterium]|nr:hypothetical protein [Phycisphaerae bacterium]